MFIYKDDDSVSPMLARPARRRWHAVAIVGTTEACAAAQARKDTRYLSPEAPRLPLPDCNANCCDCRYTHFEDRRRGARRADERTGATPKRVSAEQRIRNGRRGADHGSG